MRSKLEGSRYYEGREAIRRRKNNRKNKCIGDVRHQHMRNSRVTFLEHQSGPSCCRWSQVWFARNPSSWRPECTMTSVLGFSYCTTYLPSPTSESQTQPLSGAQRPCKLHRGKKENEQMHTKKHTHTHTHTQEKKLNRQTKPKTKVRSKTKKTKTHKGSHTHTQKWKPKKREPWICLISEHSLEEHSLHFDIKKEKEINIDNCLY